MSVRAIASVGVMLCAAVTSFSIYLGVIEHAYSPAHIRVVTLVSERGRNSTCVSTQRQRNTSTTDVTKTKVGPCAQAQAQALGK